MRTDAENEPKRVDISATPLPKEIPPVVSSNQVGLPVVTRTSAPTSAEGSKYSWSVLSIVDGIRHLKVQPLSQRQAVGVGVESTIHVCLCAYAFPIDFIFHAAIYSSLSPSDGVTLNCMSTNRDIAYLWENGYLPTYRFC